MNLREFVGPRALSSTIQTVLLGGLLALPSGLALSRDDASSPGAGATEVASAGRPGLCPESFVGFIDVGHTPSQPGAVSARGAVEFDFNRRLAQTIQAEFAAQGSSNISTLEDIMALPLRSRAERFNASDPGLVLSVHHDSVQPKYLEPWVVDGQRRFFSDAFRGYSLFVSRRNAFFEQSMRFAELLADSLLKRGRTFTLHHAEDIDGERRELIDAKRGIYRFDDLFILHLTKAPAVLLEAGVIVNRDEEQDLSSDATRKLIAEAVVEATKAFCTTQ